MQLTELTPKKGCKQGWFDPFLAALAQTANVSAACQSARVSRTLAYRQRKTSQTFAARWKEALETAVDALELEARRRAMGWLESELSEGGDRMREVHKHSDTLLIFLLKAHRPEKYRENYRVEVNARTVEEQVSFVIVDNGRDPGTLPALAPRRPYEVSGCEWGPSPQSQEDAVREP
jgi:hypothetical protein